MRYVGDFAEDATVRILFTTNDGSGGAVAPASAFEAADVAIYKDGGATQKATTNGLTMTSPFDAVTGLHLLAIDTSVDTGDAGFWATGSDYIVVLSPDETVDSQTVVAVIGTFSIENRTVFPKADYPTNFAALGIEADGHAHADVKEIEGVDATDQVRDAILDDATRFSGADVGAILLDTAEIGAAGAGLTEAGGTGDHLTAVPWNAAWDAEVQSEAADALTAYDPPTKAELDSAIAGLNDPTAATVAAAVWDALQSAHVTAGSFGETATEIASILADTNELQTDDVPGLIAALENLSAAEAADAVWDEAQADHVAAGSFGETATEIAAILVDTGTDIPALIAALNDLSAAEVNAEVDTALGDYDAPTRAEATSDKAEILTRLGTPAGADIAADIAAVDTVVDAIKVVTDALGATAAARLALSATEMIPFTVDTATNGHTPTTTEFQADDITEATADHYNGRIVVWTSGALKGQATSISDYEAVGGIGQFTVVAMTEAPANNDTGIIV